MSGVYTLIGAIVGALIAFGSAHYVQKRNAALAESDRTHADEQRAEDIERDQERHRRDTQRAAAVLALSHVNVFLDHARELTFALDRDDEQRLGEVWPRYLDAWSSMAASRVHVNVAGPEELRTILPSVRDTLLEYGGRCDAWYYDRARPRDIDAAEQRAYEEYDTFLRAAQVAVGVPAGLSPTPPADEQPDNE